LEYNATEPVNDRECWLDQFVHLMGHRGNYSREEAIVAIDKERSLPDVLSFDPSKPFSRSFRTSARRIRSEVCSL
jgi:hypothetical protein